MLSNQNCMMFFWWCKSRSWEIKKEPKEHHTLFFFTSGVRCFRKNYFSDQDPYLAKNEVTMIYRRSSKNWYVSVTTWFLLKKTHGYLIISGLVSGLVLSVSDFFNIVILLIRGACPRRAEVNLSGLIETAAVIVSEDSSNIKNEIILDH